MLRIDGSGLGPKRQRNDESEHNNKNTKLNRHIQVMCDVESPFTPFQTIYQAVCNAELPKLLPNDICKAIVEYRGGIGMVWDLVGDDVEVSNDGLTIKQLSQSKSALGNVVLKPNTGVYSWTISVDCIMRNGGCKYIGVVNCQGIGKSNLNSNLQSGCSGHRIAWDGACSSIYHDIDSQSWPYSTRVGKGYKTGDTVTVSVDTDKKEVTFGHNGKTIPSVIKYEGDYNLKPVVGFGYENGTEQYTIKEWSWW